MFNLIKQGLGWLFGGSDAASKVVSTGAEMVDNAFYTDQEKGVANQKVLDWYLQYQKVTSKQNVARRIIAFAVVSLWIFLVLLAVISKSFSPSYSEFVFDTLEKIVSTPFEIIIAFYFAAHVVRSMASNK